MSGTAKTDLTAVIFREDPPTGQHYNSMREAALGHIDDARRIVADMKNLNGDATTDTELTTVLTSLS